MSLNTLDRTQWSYAEALEHVQSVTVARRAAEAAKLPPKPATPHHHWGQPQDPTVAWKAEAETELLVALRDGDLIAQGRYSEERTHGWGNGGNSSGFGLHSGYHTSIRPEQWREGKYFMGRLTAMNWEFIDIRMPRFMVKAIWQDFVPQVLRPSTDASDAPYTTPYFELMQAAIARFGITAENQGKKDCLMDWFLEQQVEGEPVSRNLADATATLVPSALCAARGRQAGARPVTASGGVKLVCLRRAAAIRRQLNVILASRRAALSDRRFGGQNRRSDIPSFSHIQPKS